MASTSLSSSVQGQCLVNLQIMDHIYPKVILHILPDFCSDVILIEIFVNLKYLYSRFKITYISI